MAVEPQVQISIIICTRDRCDSLQATLECIGRTSVPTDWKVELMVIDNGSSDATKRISLAMHLENMPIHYVPEPRKGKGYAYNTGMSAAQGQILLFTDDDVRVPQNWIANMCQPIIEGAADAVAGGVVFPPDIADSLSRLPFSSRRSWFASSEELDPIRPIRMIGANMAFHRRVLEQVPGYDVELGPGALGFGDETLFSRQILAAGYKLAGALDVAVEHHFDLTRLTSDRLITLARNMGRSHAFIFYHWEHQKSRFPTVRLFFSTRKLHQAQRAYESKGHSDVTVFQKLLEAEKNHAFDDEYSAQSRRPRKYALRGLVPLSIVSGV